MCDEKHHSARSVKDRHGISLNPCLLSHKQYTGEHHSGQAIGGSHFIVSKTRIDVPFYPGFATVLSAPAPGESYMHGKLQVFNESHNCKMNFLLKLLYIYFGLYMSRIPCVTVECH